MLSGKISDLFLDFLLGLFFLLLKIYQYYICSNILKYLTLPCCLQTWHCTLCWSLFLTAWSWSRLLLSQYQNRWTSAAVHLLVLIFGFCVYYKAEFLAMCTCQCTCAACRISWEGWWLLVHGPCSAQASHGVQTSGLCCVTLGQGLQQWWLLIGKICCWSAAVGC